MRLRKRAGVYWADVTIGRKRIRRSLRCTDKGAAEVLAAELQRRLSMQAAGLCDPHEEHKARPLAEHLDGYAAQLANTATSKTHLATVVPRVRKLLDGCGFRYWGDVSASAVQAFLADLRNRRGLSVQTSNFYLSAAKAFFGWMVRDRRALENPLAHVRGGNVRTDRRHDRRALSVDELVALLDATRRGPERFGMPAADRHALYTLAVESGLRAGELRSLTWGCLSLKADPPTVTVRAAYAKNRRDDTLPLKAGASLSLGRGVIFRATLNTGIAGTRRVFGRG